MTFGSEVARNVPGQWSGFKTLSALVGASWIRAYVCIICPPRFECRRGCNWSVSVRSKQGRCPRSAQEFGIGFVINPAVAVVGAVTASFFYPLQLFATQHWQSKQRTASRVAGRGRASCFQPLSSALLPLPPPSSSSPRENIWVSYISHSPAATVGLTTNPIIRASREWATLRHSNFPHSFPCSFEYSNVFEYGEPTWSSRSKWAILKQNPSTFGWDMTQNGISYHVSTLLTDKVTDIIHVYGIIGEHLICLLEDHFYNSVFKPFGSHFMNRFETLFHHTLLWCGWICLIKITFLTHIWNSCLPFYEHIWLFISLNAWMWLLKFTMW